MVAINLLGPIKLTAALLPLLTRQKRATIMNVTSGLAFVPGAGVPTYSATKAGMHSYTQSLRRQLQDSPVEVIEVIPPYVQTNLGSGHAADARAMPLPAFITEVFSILQAEVQEVVVERCKPLRLAAERGTFGEAFENISRMTIRDP